MRVDCLTQCDYRLDLIIEMSLKVGPLELTEGLCLEFTGGTIYQQGRLAEFRDHGRQRAVDFILYENVHSYADGSATGAPYVCDDCGGTLGTAVIAYRYRVSFCRK